MTTITRPAPGSVEERTAPQAPELVDGKRLRGVVPYSVESRDLGGFTEIIEPGALTAARLDDLIATVDHVGIPIGRFPTTLDVEDRADGLHWSLSLPESRGDLREAIERGDLRAGSWRMIVKRDEYRGDVRHIHEIAELRDVSIVTNPAYPQALTEYRSETPTPAIEPEKAETMQTTTATAEDRTEGRLAVEDRTASVEPVSVEHRVIDALRGVPRGENRALTTAVTISPGELSTFLFDRLRASSVLLATGIATLQTEADSVVYPTLSSDVTPAFYAEAAAITPGDPTFGTVTATPRKLAHLVQLSNEVLDDSHPSIAAVLNDHLLRVLALRLDAALLEGSGIAPEIRGVKNIAGIQTLSVGVNGATPTLDNIADAIALLEAANVPLARMRVVAHPRNVAAIRKSKASTAGSYLYGDPSAASPSTIFGVPVVTSPQLGTAEPQGTSTVTNSIYVYDTQSLVYVQRSAIAVELDRSRLFNSDQSEMRAKLRGDLISPTPNGIVRITGALA